MTKINKSFALEIKSSDDLLEKANEYFTRSGFHKIRSTDCLAQFAGGSTLQNLVTFNPLKWKSKIRIELKESALIVHISLNTFGQVINERELMTWKEFIDNFENFINNSQFNYEESNNTFVTETKSKNFEIAKWLCIGMIIGAVPGGIVLKITDNIQIGFMAMAFAAIAFYFFKSKK